LTNTYSPTAHLFPIQPSTGPSSSHAPFGYTGAATPDRDPRPFARVPFLSTSPRSDSWHRIGQNFACAYICTYLPVALGRCWCSLLPPGFPAVPPYLDPTFRLDNTRPPWVTDVSSAPCRPHTPWYDEEEPLRLRLHSAGSTIPRLGPTGSSSGWLPSITTRCCSSSPSDLTSR
jgi:hypothetical protein